MASVAQRASSSRAAVGTVALALLLASGGGCGHARSVGEPPEEGDAKRTEREHAPAKTSGHEAERKTERKSTRGVNKEPAPTKVEGVTLTSSPGGVLRSGAARAIQLRLVKSGELAEAPSGELDGATRAALARFQRAHDLPATGVPDNATVDKLGLKSDDVFESTKAEARAKEGKADE